MKQIQFKTTNGNEKTFVDELKKNVSEYFKVNKLSTKGNSWINLKITLVLSVYIIPWFLISFGILSPWIAFLLCIVMGIGEAGIGMCVMHDAAHGALSRRKWVNTLFESSIYILGSNLLNWKIQHNLFHHSYTNIYKYDPDIGTKAVIRLCDHAKVRKYHRYQYIYAFPLYGLMTLSKIIMDIPQLFQFNKNRILANQKVKPSTAFRILWLSKTLYFGLILGIPLYFSIYSWWQILIGFIVIHLTAGMIMSTIFQMAHVVEGAAQPLPDTNGIIPHEALVHQILCTSNFAPNNRFLSWYIGGLNYQIEHHVFPHICHVHYRKIAPIVRTTALKYEIPYNLKPTLFDAFISHVNRLKELGNGKNKLK